MSENPSPYKSSRPKYPDPAFTSTIKGFLNEEEGLRLFDLALAGSRKGPCLEIGSYCGKSTVYLGSACRYNQAILYSIDHHRGSEEQQPGEEYFDPELYDDAAGQIDTFPAFRRTLTAAGLEDTVVPLVCTSNAAAFNWNTSLGLVFIDGGHAYETVLDDYKFWSPHLLPDGLLLMHDIFKDPQQGGQAPYRVYRQAIASGSYEVLPMTGSLGVLKRSK